MKLSLPLAALLVVSSSLSIAKPPKKGKGPPPPAIEAADDAAKAGWNKRLKLSSKGKCEDLINPTARFDLTRADPTLDEVKADAAAYLALARCAEKQKYYVLEADLAALIAKADKKNPHLELFVRALLGLGANDDAIELLNKALEGFPDDPDLHLSGAKAYCRIRNWEKCKEYATKADELSAKMPDKDKEAVSGRAHKYLSRVYLHTGEFDLIELSTLMMELNNSDKEAIEGLEQALVPAKTWKLVVEPEYATHVALGVYHLTGKLEGLNAPVKVVLTNLGDDRQVRVEAGLSGITSTATKTVSLRKGKEAVVELTPPLLANFDATSVRATKNVSLELKVTSIGSDAKESVVLQETREVSVEPRDFLPMSAAVDKEKRVKRFSYVGAWVTPNAKAVEAFLTKAKANAPGETFSGEQSATLPQVKALFDTLKAEGVSYVMDPNVMSGLGFGQRTRLPSEVLASTNAQCLEGSLLYASLLESIGLQPEIIFVPGHAFVGWKASAKDGVSATTHFFLETTMTHDGEYEQALLVAKKEFEEADSQNEVTVLPIGALRKNGVTPQPFE
ncbi:MAG: hypothetical protein U0228_04720 [Myxococcaceae bacterium]